MQLGKTGQFIVLGPRFVGCTIDYKSEVLVIETGLRKWDIQKYVPRYNLMLYANGKETQQTKIN